MQLTSRGQQCFTSQQREVEWRCAGLCCRRPAAGCFIRRTTAASLHWISANREKRSGESAAFDRVWRNNDLRNALSKHPFSVFKTSHMLEFSIIKDALGLWWWLTVVVFPLDISSLPNYWDGTSISRSITSPENLLVDIIFINQAIF